MSESVKALLIELSGYANGALWILPAMWVTFLLDQVLPLSRLGLVPRSATGLIGVLFMPFLHSDLRHLIANSVPLAVLILLVNGERLNTVEVMLAICVIGGFMLWLAGRRALHVGASLLLFGLSGFHLTTGLVEQKFYAVAVAVLVAVVYGSRLLGSINPLQRGVSWEGHLFGIIAGVLTAFYNSGFDIRQAEFFGRWLAH